MSGDQKTFFGEPEAKGPVNGKSAQRLFVPKLLADAAIRFDKRTPERDHAFDIIRKWADLEASGKLLRMKETNLEGEFFADFLSTALGYTIFSQNIPQWDLRAKFPVQGQTADGAIGTFRADGNDPPRVLIELKGPKSNIDRDRASGRTPVQQCWDYLNLVPQCPWGLVCNYVSFRLYHRAKTPRAYEQFYLRDLADFNNFREFYYLFERGGFLPTLIGQPPRCDELLRRSETTQQEVGNKLYKFYHDQRVALINYLRRPPHDRSLDDAIYIAQKLLDRVFFIAFCQYRLLLPESTLERTWREVPPFSLVTNPRWENFKQLFRSIDRGNPAANISAFNGGLFEIDPKVDDLQLDDQWTTSLFRVIGTYDFKDEVSVEVLGHLFEQSITDLETLRTDPDAALAPEKKKPAGKRKREGVYYTPAFITQFIVRETIGPCLRERFAQLAEQLGLPPVGQVFQPDGPAIDPPSSPASDRLKALSYDAADRLQAQSRDPGIPALAINSAAGKSSASFASATPPAAAAPS